MFLCGVTGLSRGFRSGLWISKQSQGKISSINRRTNSKPKQAILWITSHSELKVSSNCMSSPHLSSTYCGTCTAAWPSQSQSSCVLLKSSSHFQNYRNLWVCRDLHICLMFNCSASSHCLPRKTSSITCVIASNSHSALQYTTIKKRAKRNLTRIHMVGCLLLFVCQPIYNVVHEIHCSLTFQCNGAIFFPLQGINVSIQTK